MVTLPVPVSTLRNTYRDRLLFPEKGWRLPDKRENTGPPEQGVNCYCFGLLLTTSGAVVGIFGRGAKGGVLALALNTPAGFGIPGLGIATSYRNLTTICG